MAKSYFGVENVPKAWKKIYVGDAQNTPKVGKKVFVGDSNGKAQVGWGEQKKELSYYGTATPMTVTRHGAQAVSVGDFALIGGGLSYSDSTPGAYAHNDVITYSSSLVRGSASALLSYPCKFAATSDKSHALFAGGFDRVSATTSSPVYATVTAYDISLTRSSVSGLTTARGNLSATHVGQYMMFGGGSYKYGNNHNKCVADVDVYNNELTKLTNLELSSTRHCGAAASVGNYALFGGGLFNDSYTVDTVDAYDTSLTKVECSGCNYSVSYQAATSAKNYAIFGGGWSYSGSGSSQVTSSVTAYDKSLTRVAYLSGLIATVAYLAATSIDEYAIFAGGGSGSSGTTAQKHVTVYDGALTRTDMTKLSQVRLNLTATSVGDYALFAGGNSGMTSYSTVDVYQVSQVS